MVKLVIHLIKIPPPIYIYIYRGEEERDILNLMRASKRRISVILSNKVLLFALYYFDCSLKFTDRFSKVVILNFSIMVICLIEIHELNRYNLFKMAT